MISIQTAAKMVIKEYPDRVSEYSAGNELLFGFFVRKIRHLVNGTYTLDEIRETLKKLLPSPGEKK